MLDISKLEEYRIETGFQMPDQVFSAIKLQMKNPINQFEGLLFADLWGRVGVRIVCDEYGVSK